MKVKNKSSFIVLLALLTACPLFAQQRVAFPYEFTPALHGHEVIVCGPLYVTGNYGYSSTNPVVTVAPEVLITGTEVVLPGTDYQRQHLWNNENKLIVDHFTVPDTTVRVGSHVDSLQGIVSFSSGTYSLRLTVPPTLLGNERPPVPLTDDADRSNLRIVGANLQFFLASPSSWGSGWGADNQAAFERQKTKVVAMLSALDADIYALCEVEEGDYTVQRLADWLNESVGMRVYEFVDGGDDDIDTYTKNVFLYRSDRVLPVGAFTFTDNDYTKLRHVAQRFRLRANDEHLILAMNHFKSKSGSGSGADANRGDGQSSYNLTRTEEAEAVLLTCTRMAASVGDDDILILGDLNAYSMEDPVRTFTDAGFVNELRLHAPRHWSYCFNDEVGYLDHALASPSLHAQVVDAMPWDINASEPSYFGYAHTVYYTPEHYIARCSDHNPIVVTLNLGGTADVTETPASHHVQVYTLQGDLLLTTEVNDLTDTDALWQTFAPALPSGIYILQIPGIPPVKIFRP